MTILSVIGFTNMQSNELIKPIEQPPITIDDPIKEEEPVKNLKIDGVRLLSNDKHLKLLVKDGMQLFDAIAFNMGDRKFKIGDKVDILHSLEINTFNNIERVQLNVKDIKKSCV